MPKKPVLQFGSLAGWPYCLAEALTDLGCASENVIPLETDVLDLDRKLPYHHAISCSTSPRWLRSAQRFKFLLSVSDKYSLVHYHGSHLLRGSLHHLLEGRYLAARHVPMMVSFGGGDARIVEQARAKNPYFYRQLDSVRDDGIRQYLRSLSRYVRYVATDCEMAEYVAPYFERVFTFRQPVNLERFKAPQPNVDRLPIILHVPTEPTVKGTDAIVAAVERLKSEGVQFEFRSTRRLTQATFYQELADCDVYVDELRCGAHGVTAVEAMALAKPTITYIRPDLVEKYPAEMPLVNANPDTVYTVLRKLISEPSWRAELSMRGRAYVEQYHAAPIVAKNLLEAYRSIGY